MKSLRKSQNAFLILFVQWSCSGEGGFLQSSKQMRKLSMYLMKITLKINRLFGLLGKPYNKPE